MKKVIDKLKYLYGEKEGNETAKILQNLVKATNTKSKTKKIKLWDEKDIALITYPDSFIEKEEHTLATLNKFLETFVKDKFNIIHVLPFYPHSADRGFSVTNYYKVKKEFGDWDEIKKITSKYRLMTDLISNHVSRKHKWFRAFLNGDKNYQDYFIWFDKNNLPPDDQIKMVRRGRATPLLNPFKTKNGLKYLWTTYSINNLIDQIDLNYHNPKVLIEIIKVFLFYLSKDVDILRFDGIGGLWKKLGTTCKHLPENHTVISILRELSDSIRPDTLIVTETTTGSYQESYSYMNDEEAHIFYNFALAPHVLLSFYKGTAEKLNEFASSLKTSSNKNTFFNILDVHDGINMYAASKILDKKDLEIIVNSVKDRGGELAYRILPDGSKEVKEMPITWWSALNKEGDESFEIQLRKFITSRAIAMSLKGIPSFYYLSLFGGKNDRNAFEKSKHTRDINRTNFDYEKLSANLLNSESRESKIFKEVLKLVEKRKTYKAFHPNSEQEILSLDNRVFALVRGIGNDQVLALHNVSKDTVSLKYKGIKVILQPYSFVWQPSKL